MLNRAAIVGLMKEAAGHATQDNGNSGLLASIWTIPIEQISTGHLLDIERMDERYFHCLGFVTYLHE
jgi:hypothetical protein